MYALILLVGLAPALAKPPPGTLDVTGETVAEANGAPITDDMLRAVRLAATAQRGDLSELSDEERNGFIEALAVAHVLYEQAIDARVHRDPLVELTIQIAARNVIVGEWLRTLGDAAAQDEAAVTAMYEARDDLYGQPRVRARHLLVKTRDEIDAAAARLAAGEDFGALAGELSLDPGSKANGGDLGFFGRGMMVEEFEDAAFAAQVGVVEVTERQARTPLEEVREAIEAELRNEAVRQAYEETRAALDLSVVGDDSAEEAP